MHCSVDLAGNDFLRTGNRNRSDLCAQVFAGPVHFLLDLGLREAQDALAFLIGRYARLFYDMRAAGCCLVDNIACLPPCFVEQLALFHFGQLERTRPFLRRGKSIRNLCLTLFDHTH